MLGSAERRTVKLILISREIIFQEFRQSTNVTDRRTDGQLIMPIPRYATLRAVKKAFLYPIHTADSTHLLSKDGVEKLKSVGEFL